MNDNAPDTSTNHHLGMRIAVGLVGLAVIVVFVMLARVSMKQSDTTEALETYESLQEEVRPAVSGD